MVQVSEGVRLCVDSYGDPADPLVLLLAGAASPMDWWQAGFCQLLADGGRHVVRYDHRDTGASTQWPLHQPGYGGADLALDAVRLMDAFGVASAHLVGVSMGGGLAQDLAVRCPDRVRTLTLVATSCAFTRRDDTPLPGPEARLSATFEDPEPTVDWSDEAAVVEHVVATVRPYAGSAYDEERTRAIARDVVRRTGDVRASLANHWDVIGSDEDSEPHTMAEVGAPVLVVHGTQDPLFPLPHGRGLARETGGRLVVLPGTGHEHPPEPTWDVVVPAILGHTAED